jgi:hypothetical protein
MLYSLGVWITGLFLASPLIPLAIAYVRAPGFHKRNDIPSQKRALYWTALALCLANAIVYLSYWAWRVCKLYNINVTLTLSLWLERSMYAAVGLAAIALGLVVLGRGPYRVFVALSIIWIAGYLWLRLPIMHWA